MKSKAKFSPVFWGAVILVVAEAFTIYFASLEKAFVEANQISAPQIPLQLPIIYFFGAAAALGVVLFLVPVSALRILLKAMFASLFSYGMFIVLFLSLPLALAAFIAVAAGVAWVLKPKVWLHNLVLMVALASVGLVFGFVLSPWTAITFMLVISVYDVLAVRFGYMLWMAKRLSHSDILPAFVIPRKVSAWNLNLKAAGFSKLFEDPAAERQFSILGGGDVGFPLLVAVSAFFAYGFYGATIVAAFSVLGLVGAFLIQIYFLKGKPMPALPPIFAATLIGLLVVRALLFAP